MQYLFVFLGGGLGSVTRFFLSNLVNQIFGIHFPHGTLAVNVIGSCIIGILFSINEHRLDSIPIFRQLIFIGFLGGFTTFSSFSLETMTLFLQAKFISAILNVFLNLSLCLVAVNFLFFWNYLIAKVFLKACSRITNKYFPQRLLACYLGGFIQYGWLWRFPGFNLLHQN
ncbi:MAG: fluoride efflux transporter CrcB [Leptospiraceae bacterium]|nr:fluoride efflux transporter CrcB [Leptospiraceae bacterium]